MALLEAPQRMSSRDKRWWSALAAVIIASFVVLLWMGQQINVHKPPIPERVETAQGKVLVTKDQIINGQQVWQSIGGQQIGSVWGHGAYVAPDWTADWLHREATQILDKWAQKEGASDYAALGVEKQAALKARLKSELRTNGYQDGRIVLSDDRVAAFEANKKYYAELFANGHENYAIPKDSIKDEAAAQDMAAFFWWTSWAASTNSPGSEETYTQNWPHEQLIDNVPPTSNILWSIISFILLLAGIGGLVWYQGWKGEENETPDVTPEKDPLLGFKPTPSQRATLKYFFIVGLLFVLQIACGIIAAHYGVEGGALFGIPIDKILPYAVVRTWHTQLGIFWIATAWFATGLYVGPAVGGKEPKFQRLGVNILFGALLVVVLGSMAGEWASIMGKLGYGNPINFWLGTQGYEYVDLGRVFQIGLFIGLALWFILMCARSHLQCERPKPCPARSCQPRRLLSPLERNVL